MSIYTNVDTGTGKLYRNRVNKSHRWLGDIQFGALVPFMRRFVNPGDVWKCAANVFIRLQPMVSPSLTQMKARLRYFFVPLRLVEENTEKIITGSDNGKVIDTELPVFAGAFDVASVTSPSAATVTKHSFWDYIGIPCMDYKNVKAEKSVPAAYWYKGYLRIVFDYYQDENLRTNSDFENYVYGKTHYAVGSDIEYVMLPKDYITSSLPWQLKGITPTFEVKVRPEFQPTVSGQKIPENSFYFTSSASYGGLNVTAEGQHVQSGASRLVDMSSYFDMADIRSLAAQTRVFERLARTGSRFTEYLRANFNGIAPDDGTLQRAQFLGGFSQPIVTTEIAQTAEDGTTPVGTLRGHGISSGSNGIKPFVAKEPGMIFGLIDVLPDIQYTQGIDRELTYKTRFDFFNPSFQLLSEQEVRNGEVYFSDDSAETNPDNKNDGTFGFQGMYNELRSSHDIVTGNLRDTLAYWTQALKFSTRPHLNEFFLNSKNHVSSFNRPFAVTDDYPIICDIYNSLDVYRMMVKNPTPGLMDHL